MPRQNHEKWRRESFRKYLTVVDRDEKSAGDAKSNQAVIRVESNDMPKKIRAL